MEFQSTPPHGGRPRNRLSVPWYECFNPRPRTGGDTGPSFLSASRFQSTPPHGGRRLLRSKVPMNVSIHAPARGAKADPREVSIHAPARGATISAWTVPAVSIHAPARGAKLDWFQSTPPHGGRRRGMRRQQVVSIHAPARGATMRKVHSFNPRPRTGGDFFCWSAQEGSFNPRPRTGGDSSLVTQSTSLLSFNPRPRTGGDQRLVNTRPWRCFNPRPRTGGARATTPQSSFNPRPRTGGDHKSQRIQPIVSIHAPARGATGSASVSADTTKFQSTPPHGGRRSAVAMALECFNPRPRTGGMMCCFNPRPRTGGDRNRR